MNNSKNNINDAELLKLRANSVRLDVESARVLLNMEQLGILDVAQISNNIEQQNFLSKCLSNISFFSEMAESFALLSAFNGETIDSVETKLSQASESFKDIFQYDKQIYKYRMEFMQMSRNFYSLQSVSNPENLKIHEFACSFENEMLVMYGDDYIKLMSDRNFALSFFVNQYWDYIYEDVQKFILSSFDFEKDHRGWILESIGEYYIQKVPFYEQAFLLLESSILKASASLAPKLPLPKFVRNVSDNISANKGIDNKSDEKPSVCYSEGVTYSYYIVPGFL